MVKLNYSKYNKKGGWESEAFAISRKVLNHKAEFLNRILSNQFLFLKFEQELELVFILDWKFSGYNLDDSTDLIAFNVYERTSPGKEKN